MAAIRHRLEAFLGMPVASALKSGVTNVMRNSRGPSAHPIPPSLPAAAAAPLKLTIPQAWAQLQPLLPLQSEPPDMEQQTASIERLPGNSHSPDVNSRGALEALAYLKDLRYQLLLPLFRARLLHHVLRRTVLRSLRGG